MQISFKNNSLYNSSLKIVKTLQEAGFSAYFVGGAVRDKILGKPVKDIDIATSAKPEDITHLFQKTYLIGADFGIVNVVENAHNIEVATFRKESGYFDGRHPEKVEYTVSPQEDALRRDFTVNALFFDPVKDQIFDFVGGFSDIKKGIIRTIGKPEFRLNEDYLRILRAIRFGFFLDFTIDERVFEYIKLIHHNLTFLSEERIRDELNKIFTGPKAGDALECLSNLGILEIILPEIEEMKGVLQPKKYHPEGDVFEHTKLMMNNMVSPSIELAWSVLLHDVGKPKAYSIDKDGIPHFYCHDEVGTTISEEILRKYRFSKKEIKRICFAVKNHMKYADVQKMRAGKLARLMAEPTFGMEIELHRLDCISSNNLLGNFVFLLDKLIEKEGEREIPAPLVNGNDLKRLGLKPGPIFSTILSRIRDKQLDGEIETKEEAIKLIVDEYL